MTAPTDDLRARLAEALWPFVYGGSIDHRDQGHVLDALLPVVESYGRACAATALRDPADELLTLERVRAFIREHPADAVPQVPLAELARIVGADR